MNLLHIIEIVQVVLIKKTAFQSSEQIHLSCNYGETTNARLYLRK